MANKFDRIIKENFQELTVWLLKRMLGGVKAIKVVPLLPKIQRTLEREADMLILLLCSDEEGEFIANVEWQSGNDKTMLKRLLLYYALAYHLYGLPVKTYVVYMGRNKVTMPSEIDHPLLNFRYHLINLSDISPEEFLSSNVPEEVIMAILAGHKTKDERRSVIRKILRKLRRILRKDESTLNRKIVQLEVLAELRNIQKLIVEEENNMAIRYNIKKDIRYQQGMEEGVEKGRSENKTAFVKNLLKENVFTIEKIAELANVSTAFVQQIKGI
jgi:predicted transposase/invertase (TIGR01784 family)